MYRAQSASKQQEKDGKLGPRYSSKIAQKKKRKKSQRNRPYISKRKDSKKKT